MNALATNNNNNNNSYITPDDTVTHKRWYHYASGITDGEKYLMEVVGICKLMEAFLCWRSALVTFHEEFFDDKGKYKAHNGFVPWNYTIDHLKDFYADDKRYHDKEYKIFMFTPCRIWEERSGEEENMCYSVSTRGPILAIRNAQDWVREISNFHSEFTKNQTYDLYFCRSKGTLQLISKWGEQGMLLERLFDKCYGLMETLTHKQYYTLASMYHKDLYLTKTYKSKCSRKDSRNHGHWDLDDNMNKTYYFAVFGPITLMENYTHSELIADSIKEHIPKLPYDEVAYWTHYVYYRTTFPKYLRIHELRLHSQGKNKNNARHHFFESEGERIKLDFDYSANNYGYLGYDPEDRPHIEVAVKGSKLYNERKWKSMAASIPNTDSDTEVL